VLCSDRTRTTLTGLPVTLTGGLFPAVIAASVPTVGRTAGTDGRAIRAVGRELASRVAVDPRLRPDDPPQRSGRETDRCRPRSLPLTRVLLFTGKGGVGKTSVAAATAARAARRGARVLVTSTDPAHSLADALDVALGDRPTPVSLPAGTARSGGSLAGQQLDAQLRLEQHWGEVRDYLRSLLSWGGVGDVAAEELVTLPGLDELFSLIELQQQVLGGRYDLVVVDCAPTAETLKLLALPDALRWYADRVLGPGARMARAVRPLARSLGSVAAEFPLPGDHVAGAVDRLHLDLTGVHELLTDPTRSSVRLVVNPERLVLAEAQRTATSLSLFGYAVDALVVNRLLPDHLTDPYLARWKQRHAQHLHEARTAFAPLPVLTAPLFDDELAGVGDLMELGEQLYGERDEQAVLHVAPPVTVEVVDDRLVLRVALPFATEDQLELHQRGEALHVKVAGAKRVVHLPAALRRRDVSGARLRDGVLEVRFADAPTAVGAS
jgi:arsenite/tail-anchored protein-transporting ATPase